MTKLAAQLLIAILLAAPILAQDSSVVEGTALAIDLKSSTITVAYPDPSTKENRKVQLLWTEKTRFLQQDGSRLLDASETSLKVGDRVKCGVHDDESGKKILDYVYWHGSAARGK